MALYHSARGSVNYTIVGSPTIVDGVASDFSSSNLLQINNFDPSKPFVISTKIRFTATGERQYFVGVNTSGKIRIIIFTDQKLLCNLGGASNFNIGEIKSTQELSTNTDYFVKLEFTGSKYILSLSEDNAVYSIIGEIVSSAYINGGTPFNLQLGSGNLPSVGFYFRGSIDLNHTYITVNGQPWFGICPVEVKKHQIMGPVGYTVVGSPTITDGIASGFSNSDYVTVPYFLPFSKNSFEYVIKFKIGISNSVTNGTIFSFPYRKDGSQGAAYGIYKYSNALTAYCGYNANGDNITLSIPFTANSDMWVKWSFANGILKLTYSTDGINWNVGVNNEGGTEILDGTVQDISLGRISSWPGFSVDLNHTYIKVNGKLWFWQPQATKYIQRNNQLVWADPKLYLSGPVNYEVVGSPTIADGVASGFSANNVLSIANSFPTEYSNFEQVVTFTTPNDLTQSFAIERLLMPGSRGGIDLIYNNSKLRLHAYFRTTEATGTDKAITVYTPALSANTTYTSKFMWEGTTYILELWKNGTKIGSNTLDNSNPLYIISTFSIGGTYGSADRYFHGSIDLKETYIKVNNQLWFYGKNYATQNIAPVPSEYTYGNTTTSAIGYVDMRTQQFTAAPEGATIGRGE